MCRAYLAEGLGMRATARVFDADFQSEIGLHPLTVHPDVFQESARFVR